MSYKITDKCLQCGICIDGCPEGAIIRDAQIMEADGLVLNLLHIDAARCTDCGVCVSEEWWCPAKAITRA